MLTRPVGELRAEARQMAVEQIHASYHPDQHLGAEDADDKHFFQASTTPFPWDMPEPDIDELVANVEVSFRRLRAPVQDLAAFWSACSRASSAFSLPEGANLRLAAAVWQELPPRSLTPDEQWLQNLSKRMTPEVQENARKTRQAASQSRSPITSAALSQQLDRFRKAREMRSA